MHHKETTIALICIDYRFWPKALKLLKEKYGELDLVALAGAGKNLASPSDKESLKTLLKNIEISIKLHASKKIILTNHIDCGAYGGSSKFNSPKEEIAFHKKELVEAKKKLLKQFPKLKVETVIIQKVGNKVSLL